MFHKSQTQLKMQTQSTPQLFFCSLCLRLCSLSGLHNQMCVRATFSRTKKSARWINLSNCEWKWVNRGVNFFSFKRPITTNRGTANGRSWMVFGLQFYKEKKNYKFHLLFILFFVQNGKFYFCVVLDSARLPFKWK
jgi:hypothetical protein